MSAIPVSGAAMPGTHGISSAASWRHRLRQGRPSSTRPSSSGGWRGSEIEAAEIRAGRGTSSIASTRLRRLASRRGRRAATARGRPRALGQQGGEPAADLPAGRRVAGRRLRRRRSRSSRTSARRSDPRRVDLHNWRNTPVWADARACRVSMKNAAVCEAPRSPTADLRSRAADCCWGCSSSCQSGSCTICSRTRGSFDTISLSAEARGAGAWVRRFRTRSGRFARGGRVRSRSGPSSRSPDVAVPFTDPRPRVITPASTVSPVRLIAWKYSSSPQSPSA